MKRVDRKILVIILLILFVSVVALYSSCHQKGEFAKKMIFFKQLAWLAIGLFFMFVFSKIDYRRLKEIAWPLYFFAIFFLVVVLFTGHVRMGAQRWLSLGGFNFQPSELGKLALIIILSTYFSQKSIGELKVFNRRESLLKGFIFPLIITGVMVLLVFLQPDLGTAILYFIIFMLLVYFSGVRLKYILIFMTILALLSPFAWLLLKDYQRDRLTVFLDPGCDPLGAGYTIIQSKIAVGSGMFFGKGWLSGTQNQLNFLAERHTDFIFSTIGEEWGFLGSMILAILFYLLVERIFVIANYVSNPFAKNLCFSIGAAIMVQFFVNIAMTIGLLPVVGVPLPFISYGGSSLIVFLILIGIVLNISELL